MGQLYSMFARSKRTDASPKRFAGEFNKAAALIGKPKASVVESFGGPTDATSTKYSYVLDTKVRVASVPVWYDTRLHRKPEMQCTSLVFELVDGVVGDVVLNLLDSQSDYPEFQRFYDAGVFWDVLNAQSIKPDAVQMFEPHAILWGSEPPEHIGDTGVFGADFDIELCARLNGDVPFHIEGGYRRPALVGIPTFDVVVDKWIVNRFKMDPYFNWRKLKVFRIRTLTGGHAPHEPNRIIHPLST